METIKDNLHFVKLPHQYRSEHYQNWLDVACFRLLRIEQRPPNSERIEQLKEGGLKSTRVRLSEVGELQFKLLSDTHKLSKIDTFLYIFAHIEQNPKIYFDKSNQIAQSA